MITGRAVEGSVLRDSPEIEVQVVFPRHADATVHLATVLHHCRRAVTGVGLGPAPQLRGLACRPLRCFPALPA